MASRATRRRRSVSLVRSSIGARRAESAVIETSRRPRRKHSARRCPTARRFGRGLGDRAVAVLPLGGDVVHLGVAGDRGEAPVGLEPQLLLGHVVEGQEGVGRHVELDLGRLARRLALHLGDGLVDHLDVEVVADRGDVAALVLAEQVARAPDLQVAHGDLEPAAQLRRLADGAQALVGLLGQDAVGGVEQVGVGPLAAPADPAPQLVELAQPEQVGPLDDERVHRRHVDAGLDDRRADEDVVVALPEVHRPPAPASPRPSGRGRRRCAPRAPARAAGPRSGRWTGPGCGRRRPGPRAAAPGGWPRATARSSYSPT